MPGVEGAERQDHDEREAGVGRPWFDTWVSGCRIETQVFLMRRRSAAATEAHVPSWRNWQTRMVQVHVPATVWGFESLRWHQKNSGQWLVVSGQS